jgi:hypothetical protein
MLLPEKLMVDPSTKRTWATAAIIASALSATLGEI